jgi:hypothetical protein
MVYTCVNVLFASDDAAVYLYTNIDPVDWSHVYILDGVNRPRPHAHYTVVRDVI